MPDINVQDEQGTIHNFPDGSTPEMISKAMGVKPPSTASVPTESQALANPPKSNPVPDITMQPAEFGGRYSGPVQARGGKQVVSPQESIQGMAERMKDSPTPFTNAVSASEPIGAVRTILGSKLASYAAKPLGPEAQAGAGLLGGVIAGAGPTVAEHVGRATYEPPEKISLGPLGKINRNAPPSYSEQMDLARPAHAEMTSDIQKGQQARAAAKSEMDSDIIAGRQERAAARDTMHNDLAQARNSRTGNPRTEGQQSGGFGAPFPENPSAVVESIGSPISGGRTFPKPMRPLVGTPEEWAAHDQQMKILGSEASDAGTYHAARGSSSKRTDLQSRIGKRFTQ